MRRERRKQRVKIRIPVPQKPEKVILHQKDKEERATRKTSTQYLQEFIEELDEENGDDDGQE